MENSTAPVPVPVGGRYVWCAVVGPAVMACVQCLDTVWDAGLAMIA